MTVVVRWDDLSAMARADVLEWFRDASAHAMLDADAVPQPFHGRAVDYARQKQLAVNALTPDSTAAAVQQLANDYQTAVDALESHGWRHVTPTLDAAIPLWTAGAEPPTIDASHWPQYVVLARNLPAGDRVRAAAETWGAENARGSRPGLTTAALNALAPVLPDDLPNDPRQAQRLWPARMARLLGFVRPYIETHQPGTDAANASATAPGTPAARAAPGAGPSLSGAKAGVVVLAGVLIWAWLASDD